MIIRFFLIVVLFASIRLFGQGYLEDSLTSRIMVSQDPHDKIQLMGDLAFELKNSDSKKAIEIGKQALELAENESVEDVNYCINVIGALYEADHQNDSALYYLHQSYEIAFDNSDTVLMSHALNNLGMVYINLGQYKEGLDKMKESGKLDLALGDNAGAAVSFMNVGSIQVQLDNPTEAKVNLQMALVIEKMRPMFF